MAGTSLLALIDDIASILDDVSVLSNVAMKKTSGVLGDDLALNAQQVSGVNADRELPVVWAVAKGSFLNKVILVPMALLLSAFLPDLIPILLLIGGLFLCFEGAEKVLEKFFHQKEVLEQSPKIILESEKIEGAIRTDFILSAEIITISLGSVQAAPFLQQVLSLSLIAVLMTVGVYGLVAIIVKLDDLGLLLMQKSGEGRGVSFLRKSGQLILLAAPALMKLLGVVGTVAMFLVGGGLVVHVVPGLHHFLEGFALLLSLSIEGGIGFILGVIIALIVGLLKKTQKQH